jgi:hypothetical protein
MHAVGDDETCRRWKRIILRLDLGGKERAVNVHLPIFACLRCGKQTPLKGAKPQCQW